MKLPLVNIGYKGRDIYLFERDISGSLNIRTVSDYFPYYYEPDTKGSFLAVDETRLKKVYASIPSDIAKYRSLNSYSSDILFTTNYTIDNIEEIQQTRLKYLFLDIEILAEDIPEEFEAKYPISCISIYNSFTEELITKFLPEQHGTTIETQERSLLSWFVEYIRQEKPDMILAWNSSFDYNYLYGRIKNLPQLISPVEYSMRGVDKDIYHPIGISVLDMLQLFKKVYMREASYTLDYIGEKFTGKGKEYKKVDFSKLTDIVKLRNRGDVQMLVDLEKRCNLIPYYDAIRRLTKCTWGDLYYNSRLVEYLLLAEAKKQNVVLPNKKQNIEEPEEGEETFQGAFRNIERTGLFENISKMDLGSAYPMAIKDFCLDEYNISQNREGIEVDGVYFKQNPNALLPRVVDTILKLKDELKKRKKVEPTEENKIAYEAIKAIVNSTFGSIGSPYFRLYNKSVASSITFLVRDVLHYCKDAIEKDGYRVVYTDTDSVFIEDRSDLSDILNDYIKQWAKEKYAKHSIGIRFEFQGVFRVLFILSKCRYVGYVGEEKDPEIKGLEIKRSSSSKFEAKLQRQLIDLVLNKKQEKEISDFIYSQEDIFYNTSPLEIAFPVKIGARKYQNVPIFIRAYNNARQIDPTFKVKKGELFYYVFTKDRFDVVAFNEHHLDILKRVSIDWHRMIDRTIYSKVEPIFEAMKWHVNRNKNQLGLF